MGCQRRVALPTKTKDYPRIVILVDNNSYLTLFERSLRVRLSNTTPLFLYIFAGLIEPVFLLYKKSGHPPWIHAFKLYTLYTAAMPPIAHSRYAQSCKLAFVLAEGIVKDEPIEQKHYQEEKSIFKGVEEHKYSFIIYYIAICNR